GIAHELAAVGPLAPLVLDDQVIITVLPVGGDVSVAIAGDVEEAAGDPEHPAGIVALGVLEPGGQAVEIAAVEEPDHLSRADRLGIGPAASSRQQTAGSQGGKDRGKRSR